MRLGDVSVVAVGRVAELELEDLAEILEQLDRVVDRRLPHHGEAPADAAKNLIRGRVALAFRQDLDDGEPLGRDSVAGGGERLHHLLHTRAGREGSHRATGAVC